MVAACQGYIHDDELLSSVALCALHGTGNSHVGIPVSCCIPVAEDILLVTDGVVCSELGSLRVQRCLSTSRRRCSGPRHWAWSHRGGHSSSSSTLSCLPAS